MSREGRAAHERNKAKNWQNGPLPPRCAHCRRSWNTVKIKGVTHCEEHMRACDGTCGMRDGE